jgi:hypothetical protein
VAWTGINAHGVNAGIPDIANSRLRHGYGGQVADNRSAFGTTLSASYGTSRVVDCLTFNEIMRS